MISKGMAKSRSTSEEHTAHCLWWNRNNHRGRNKRLPLLRAEEKAITLIRQARTLHQFNTPAVNQWTHALYLERRVISQRWQLRHMLRLMQITFPSKWDSSRSKACKTSTLQATFSCQIPLHRRIHQPAKEQKGPLRISFLLWIRTPGCCKRIGSWRFSVIMQTIWASSREAST